MKQTAIFSLILAMCWGSSSATASREIGSNEIFASYAWLDSLTPREQAIYWDGFVHGFPKGYRSCYREHKAVSFEIIMAHMKKLVDTDEVDANEIYAKMFYGKLMSDLCPERNQ